MDPAIFQMLFKLDKASDEIVRNFQEMLGDRIMRKIKQASENPTPKLIRESDEVMLRQLASGALAKDAQQQKRQKTEAKEEELTAKVTEVMGYARTAAND